MKTVLKRLSSILLLFPLLVFGQSDEARYTSLLASLNALKAEATYVEDMNAITKLGRAFGYYIDKGYFAEAANLFTIEGRLMYGMDGVYIGRDRIQELLTRQGGGSMNAGPGLPFGRFNMHMQLQPLVTIAEDGMSARARWREWSLLGNYKDKAEWGDAIQENAYIKVDGVWKIAEMRLFINFVAPYQGGWAAMVRAPRNWKTPVGEDFRADERSPVNYRPFPEITVPAFHYENNLSSIMAPPPLHDLPNRPDDALGQLEQRADDETIKLARQHSLRAVENLQAMFGYYFDKGLWTQAVDLFTTDGTWEFGQMGVYQGKASIARGMTNFGQEGLEEGQLNNFPMLQPVIHVSEDNSRAWGRFRSDVMRTVDGKGQWGGGLYENEYVNDNGTWKIAKQHYWVTFWGDYDKGWTGEGIIPVETMSSTIRPDAPPTVEYESFPNTYIVPFHYNNPVTGEPHRDMERLAADKAAGKNVR
jgi:hypothetical protein